MMEVSVVWVTGLWPLGRVHGPGDNSDGRDSFGGPPGS